MSEPGRTTWQAMAAVALPQTRQGRVSLVCGLAYPWVAAMPVDVGGWIALVLFLALIWAFATGTGSKLLVPILEAAAFFGVFLVGIWLLPYLANGGVPVAGSLPSSPVFSSATLCVAIVVLWVLFGVPGRAFKLGLDREGEGDARRVLVRLVTAASCVLSGAYIVLLHFGDGPLGKPHIGQVLVGALFAVVLLAPYYGSLARYIWQYGVPGCFMVHRTFVQPWRQALDELRQAAGRQGEPVMETTSDAEQAGT